MVRARDPRDFRLGLSQPSLGVVRRCFRGLANNLVQRSQQTLVPAFQKILSFGPRESRPTRTSTSEDHGQRGRGDRVPAWAQPRTVAAGNRTACLLSTSFPDYAKSGHQTALRASSQRENHICVYQMLNRPSNQLQLGSRSRCRRHVQVVRRQRPQLQPMIEPHAWVRRRTDRKIPSHHRHRNTCRRWLLRREPPRSILSRDAERVKFVRVLPARPTSVSAPDSSRNQCVSVHHHRVHLTRTSVKRSDDREDISR